MATIRARTGAGFTGWLVASRRSRIRGDRYGDRNRHAHERATCRTLRLVLDPCGFVGFRHGVASIWNSSGTVALSPRMREQGGSMITVRFAVIGAFFLFVGLLSACSNTKELLRPEA